jgi:hypothetical protein
LDGNGLSLSSLDGAKGARLAQRIANKLDLMIATTLGFRIPPSIFLRADEVIQEDEIAT